MIKRYHHYIVCWNKSKNEIRKIKTHQINLNNFDTLNSIKISRSSETYERYYVDDPFFGIHE